MANENKNDVFLSVRDIVVEYTQGRETIHAVNGVSFDLKRGSTIGLVGETGAGKTTIAKTILRILPNPPAKFIKGEVFLDGVNLIDLPENEMREYRGNKLKLENDTVCIIEGLHALNPELIPNIPRSATFKIFVSALTSVNLDNHNWIPTTDVRLIRRIVRDARYRGYTATETIARSKSVLRGEERWIYPFQEEADVMFNSALIFELAVLKRYAEPLLADVPKYTDEYTDAHRLLKELSYFEIIPEREIPPTSFLREFVGGSSFRY